jgi:hypothetical protein
MATKTARLQTDPGGTVVVFYRGWRFSFPASSDPPTVTHAQPPDGVPEAGSKVKTGGLRMRYGGWLVVFDPGEEAPLVIRALPPKLPSPINRYRRARDS